MLSFVLISECCFVDWLTDYAKNAHCYNYGPFNGMHLLRYGVFMPTKYEYGFRAKLGAYVFLIVVIGGFVGISIYGAFIANEMNQEIRVCEINKPKNFK